MLSVRYQTDYQPVGYEYVFMWHIEFKTQPNS